MIRAWIRLRPGRYLWLEELIGSFREREFTGLPPYSKREDENSLPKRPTCARSLSRISLRDCVLVLRGEERITWFRVERESFESIHNHNAFARHEEGGKMIKPRGLEGVILPSCKILSPSAAGVILPITVSATPAAFIFSRFPPLFPAPGPPKARSPTAVKGPVESVFLKRRRRRFSVTVDRQLVPKEGPPRWRRSACRRSPGQPVAEVDHGCSAGRQLQRRAAGAVLLERVAPGSGFPRPPFRFATPTLYARPFRNPRGRV